MTRRNAADVLEFYRCTWQSNHGFKYTNAPCYRETRLYRVCADGLRHLRFNNKWSRSL